MSRLMPVRPDAAAWPENVAEVLVRAYALYVLPFTRPETVTEEPDAVAEAASAPVVAS
jgi:hypothetical protein